MGWWIIPLCFPNFATVQTRQGAKKVSELQIGDEVKVMQRDNTVGYSPVIGWAHNDPEHAASFLELSTATKSITLSQDHLIPIVRNGETSHHRSLRHHEVDGLEYVKAGKVVEGDCVLQVITSPSGDESFQCVPIAAKRVIQSRGIFAPLTMAGTVVVDNIAASCYAAVQSHATAHAALAPIRMAYELRPESAAKHHEDREGKVFSGAQNYVDRLGRLKLHASRHRTTCTA
jgi:hypothetical protein